MVARVVQSSPGWLRELVQRYEKAGEAVLALGWPKGTSNVGIKYPDGTPVLLVAAVNHFGSPSRKIPARPFMSTGALEAVKATAPILEVMAVAINAGKATPEQALTEMGPFAQAAMQAAIANGKQYEPNKPSTVRRKKSSNPLNDTGLMRQSLTWQVRKVE